MSTNELRNRGQVNQTNESTSQSDAHPQPDQQNLTDRNQSPNNRLNFDDEDFVYLLNLSNFNWRVVLTPFLNLFNFNTHQQTRTLNNRSNDESSSAGPSGQNSNNPSSEQRRATDREPTANITANILNNDTLLTENMTEAFDIHLNFEQNTVFISRSHLIQVIFFKITCVYLIFFPAKIRKTIEYGLLASAVLSFLTLIYLHSLFIRSPINCLQNVLWNGEGILRVEILDEQTNTVNFNPEQNSSLKDLKELEVFSNQVKPSNFYVVEYSLEHGYLRLSSEARSKLNISIMTVTLDPNEDACFGDRLSRFILKYFLGYNDILLNSLKGLAENQGSKGFIKNLVTGEYFRFVNNWMTRMSYVPAAFIMLLFTLTISMLIRYSHHQILILTMQIFNMLQPNSTVNFPFAQICTVILALIGIEAIMSEFFNDTQTALNVILIVWAADVFDWGCCNTTITKRNFLKFFYLYHFAFYAYAYRFNGQYSNLALLSSGLFTAHSMVYFLHNYEIPYILSLFTVN